MFDLKFNTTDLPARDRFDEWSTFTDRTRIPQTLKSSDDADFRASALVRGSTGQVVARASLRSKLLTRRTPRLIRHADPEQYLFVSVLSGTSGVAQSGRATVIRPGELMILDSSYPFRAQYDGVHHVFLVDKSLVPVAPEQVHSLLARRLPGDTGSGAVLTRCLREVSRDGGSRRPPELHRLLDVAVDLLAVLIAQELDVLPRLPPESRDRALLARADAFVREHLGDPDLTPQNLAAAHHVSLRRLQQLLAAEGTTPAALIRTRRLERCRRALADPRQHDRPVHAVAARWGFPDHAHFSRLFKSTYGMSPSEYRASRDLTVRG
ncbi:helix-turn-helix domain-containing protein [Streptomyces sp. NPDC006798]|uniref:helix-turn-helix domain-containing protein n=1 Tax=Streptomyces sp. NPDC006798 TaxID=3155462 RepID=UPI0033E333B2